MRPDYEKYQFIDDNIDGEFVYNDDIGRLAANVELFLRTSPGRFFVGPEFGEIPHRNDESQEHLRDTYALLDKPAWDQAQQEAYFPSDAIAQIGAYQQSIGYPMEGDALYIPHAIDSAIPLKAMRPIYGSTELAVAVVQNPKSGKAEVYLSIFKRLDRAKKLPANRLVRLAYTAVSPDAMYAYHTRPSKGGKPGPGLSVTMEVPLTYWNDLLQAVILRSQRPAYYKQQGYETDIRGLFEQAPFGFFKI